MAVEFDNPMVMTAPSLPPLGASIVPSFAPPPTEADPWTRFGNAYSTARDAAVLDSNSTARDMATEQAVAQRIGAVKQATGQDLPNPLLDGYLPEAVSDWVAADPAHRAAPRTDLAQTSADLGLPDDDAREIRQLQVKRFQSALDALQSQYPGEQGLNQPLNVAARDLANKAVSDAASAYGAAGGGLSAFLASMAGGMAGAMRDPLQLSALLFGGGEATAFKSVAGQMLETFLRQGVVNAGAQALTEPAVQDWRRERGMQTGGTPLLEDLGTAFLFGGGIGAVAHGVGAWAKSGNAPKIADLAEKAIRGDGDAAAALDARLPEGAAPELSQALKSVAADDAASAGAPKDLPPELARRLLRDAGRMMEDPRAPLPQQPGPLTEAEIASVQGSAERGEPYDPEIMAKLEAYNSQRVQEQRNFPEATAEQRARVANMLAGERGKLSAGEGFYPEAAQAATIPASEGIVRRLPAQAANENLSDAVRADALPESVARVLGSDAAPEGRTLEAPVSRETPMGAAGEGAADAARRLENAIDYDALGRADLESGYGGSREGERPGEEGVARGPSEALSDRAPAPGEQGRPKAGEALDILDQTPVVRNGKLDFVPAAEAGAGQERGEFLAQLIENCVL